MVTIWAAVYFDSELDLFAVEHWRGAEYYNRWIIYANATKDLHNAKPYKGRVMQVTVRMYWKWAYELAKKLIDEQQIEQTLWIVLGPFHARGYIEKS